MLAKLNEYLYIRCTRLDTLDSAVGHHSYGSSFKRRDPCLPGKSIYLRVSVMHRQENPDSKEAVAPVVAPTTLTTPSSQVLVAPTKAKVSLATQVLLAPPVTRPQAKVSAGVSVASSTRSIVPKVALAQIIVEAAPKAKISFTTWVSLAPPTSRPQAKAAAVVAPMHFEKCCKPDQTAKSRPDHRDRVRRRVMSCLILHPGFNVTTGRLWPRSISLPRTRLHLVGSLF
jgi:hypothetical protein